MLVKKIIYLFLCLLCTTIAFSQEKNTADPAKKKFTLSGTVADGRNNETLIGVTIYFPELKSTTTTNEYGFYSITLPAGTYKALVSYIGFQTFSSQIDLSDNKKLDINLTVDGEELEEVIITDKKYSNDIRSPEMSLNKLLFLVR